MSAIVKGVRLVSNIQTIDLDIVHTVLYLSVCVSVGEPSLTPAFCTTSDVKLTVLLPLALSNHGGARNFLKMATSLPWIGIVLI